jgi:hypothetical protein
MFRHYYLSSEVVVSESVVVDVPGEVEAAAREIVELTGYGEVDEEQAFQDALTDLVDLDVAYNCGAEQ